MQLYIQLVKTKKKKQKLTWLCTIEKHLIFLKIKYHTEISEIDTFAWA